MGNCDILDKYLEQSLELYQEFENLEKLDLEIEYDDCLDEEFSQEEDNDEEENSQDNISNSDQGIEDKFRNALQDKIKQLQINLKYGQTASDYYDI